MIQFGSPAGWVDLIDSQVPDILELVIETWQRLPAPAANELEDPVTNRLCAALQRCPGRETYLFQIRSQTVILESDSGTELGRMDIAFFPLVPSDEIYFCLECKRLNVRIASGIRPYFAEYVRFGMFRFVRGQYANAVRNGGMLAYVLNADVAGAMTGVENNIQTLQGDLGMDSPATFQPSTIRPTDPRARETRHRRANNAEPFAIHHLFMAGDPNAPMLPDPPPKPTKAPRKPRKPKKAKST